MGYRYLPNETAHCGFFRILPEEIEAALRELKQAHPGEPEAIHEYRRHLKKARSLLKMARYAKPDTEIRASRRTLGRAGRLLAPWRDRDALLECTHAILQSEPAPPLGPLFQKVCTALKKPADVEEMEADALDNAVAEAAHLLNTIRVRLDGPGMPEVTWKILCRGIRRCYRDAKKTALEVQTGPAPEVLHQWRKDAKHLRHQFALISPVWPAYFEPMEAELHGLTDALGKTHDLILLDAAVHRLDRDILSRQESEQVREALQDRSQSETKRALRLGAFLFVEKPSAFHRRCRRYVTLWRKRCPGAR